MTVRYGTIGLLTTFLFGRSGRAAALAVGAREWASAVVVEALETMLAAISGEPCPPGDRP